MVEMELKSTGILPQDNTLNVEMSDDEIWFLKYFIKKYHPKKIVEIGISAGGNTVNLLKWKDKDAKLFSIDIATQWYQDKTKLSGWMADDLKIKNNWKIYRGYDYLDVYKEIGNNIDLIIIDTVHVMPGEILTFLIALPQLKDNCIVILHDIHLNLMHFNKKNFSEYASAAYCTGLLFGTVNSSKKWSLKTNENMPNIGAFIVDKNIKENIKDIFHILCATWHMYPYELNLIKYTKFIQENYPLECYNLFKTCLKLQSKYYNYKNKPLARIDIKNNGNNNSLEFINAPSFLNINFPDWYKNDEGSGATIHTNEKIFNLTFKCIKKGLLKIVLRGQDIQDEFGVKIPIFIKFNTFKLNKEDIFKDSVIVREDNAYIFEKRVNDGEIIEIHAEWQQFE